MATKTKKKKRKKKPQHVFCEFCYLVFGVTEAIRMLLTPLSLGSKQSIWDRMNGTGTKEKKKNEEIETGSAD